MAKLVRNTILYTIGNIVTALISFILLPLYTRYISIEGFGIVNSMQTLAAVLAILMTFALERSVYRLFYDYTSLDEQKDFLSTIFISILITGILTIGLSSLSRFFLTKLFAGIPFYPYYLYTIIYSFLLSVITFSQVIAQVKQHAMHFVILSLLIVLLTVALNIYFVVYLKQDAVGYVKGMMLGTLLVVPVALYYIHKSISYKFKSEQLKVAVAFCLPILPSLLSAWVLNLSDRVFISNYLSQTSLAIYSLGYKIASVLTFFSSAILMAYNPVFYSIANKKDIDIDANKAQLYILNKCITLIVGLAGLILLLFSDVALNLFFREEYKGAYTYMSVFILCFMINAFSGILNLMAYQEKKTKLVAVIIIISAVINILLNYFLIPRYGAFAAVITTLLCSVVNIVFMYWLAQRSYYVKIDKKVIFYVLAFYGIIYVENKYLIHTGALQTMSLKLITLTAIAFAFKNELLELSKAVKLFKAF